MSTQHQHELMIVEQKVKELALKSFSQEIEKLQAQHTENLKSLRIEDEKLIDELKQLLSRKDEEVFFFLRFGLQSAVFVQVVTPVWVKGRHCV